MLPSKPQPILSYHVLSLPAIGIGLDLHYKLRFGNEQAQWSLLYVKTEKERKKIVGVGPESLVLKAYFNQSKYNG